MAYKKIQKSLKPLKETAPKVPFECIALLLQGGGALGAYQAGVYEALEEANLEPNWVAGISIGAINAAIIAGNEAGQRVGKLREFWNGITADASTFYPDMFKTMLSRNDSEHQMVNAASALNTIQFGIPGFFKPRFYNPWLQPRGAMDSTSFYDTAPLKTTLEGLIDFDRLNHGAMRFNIGAVNVTSGNFMDFGNQDHHITADHILASGALPPGFPPIEIDGEFYWDGGLISNTPLEWLVESQVYHDTLVFQVDLWSADGNFPKNMADVLTREKDIQFSSRTRANTDRFREAHKLRHTISSLLEKLPKKMQDLPEIEYLRQHADTKVYNIVHLIYHNKDYEGYVKDFEFSRLSMEAHWKSGYDDTIKALKHPQVLQRPRNKEGVSIYDFSRKGKQKD